MTTAAARAHYIHSHRATYDKQGIVDAAVELGEYGVWSKRHVATITGLQPAFVNELLTKTDKTGGSMNVDRLGDVVALGASRDRQLAEDLLGDGFSAGMLAKLTGIPARTLSRWAE